MTITAIPALAKMYNNITYAVCWDRGSDVNFTIDFKDGSTYSWDWISGNHTQHYNRHCVNTIHSYQKAKNFTVSVTAKNEVNQSLASAITSVEPPLMDYIHIGIDYQPYYPPVKVNYTLKMTTTDPSETVFTWCDLQSNGVNIAHHLYVLEVGQTHVFSYTFNTSVSDVQARLICRNHVSSKSRTDTIILQQNTSGLAITRTKDCYSSQENGTYLVDLSTGSDVTYAITWREGVNETVVDTEKLSFRNSFPVRHNYAVDGYYYPSVVAYNKFFQESSVMVNGVNVVHPLTELTISAPTAVKTPPGTAHFSVLPSTGIPFNPTNVSCQIVGNPLAIFAPQLRQGLPHYDTFVYGRQHVGNNTATINCWNCASNLTLTHDLVVYEQIDVCNITTSNRGIPTGFNANFSITACTGSHVMYNISFGDGHSSQFRHDAMFASSYPTYAVHTYSQQNNFTVCVSGHNPVSQDIHCMPVNMTIQNQLTNLNLSGDLNVLYTPGIVNFQLTLGDSAISFTDLHCNFDWDDNSTSQVYFPTFDPSEIKTLSHKYSREWVGNRTANVTCKNLVSEVSTSHTFNVTLDEVLLSPLWSNRTVLITNTTYFFIHVARFAHRSCFELDHGDGTYAVYGTAAGTCKADAEARPNTEYHEIAFGTMVIPHSHLYDHYRGYDLILRGYNDLSNVIQLSRTVVLDLPCEFPNVTYFPPFQKTNPPKFMRSTKIQMKTKFFLDCMKTFMFNVSWRAWHQGSDGSETEINVTRIPTFGSATIPARTLPWGIVRLQVNISMFEVLGVWTANETLLNITKTPLDAGMAGGSEQSIGWNRTLRLNAIDRSFDPDFLPENKTGMKFTYYCRRPHESFPLNADGTLSDTVPVLPPDADINGGFDDGGCFLAGPGRLPARNGSFSINTYDMKINTTVIIMLKMCKDTRCSYFNKTVNVLMGDPPELDMW